MMDDFQESYEEDRVAAGRLDYLHVYRHESWAPKRAGVRILKVWRFGRYNTWFTELVDERRLHSSGKVTWACRTCGETTNHGQKRYCDPDCKRVFAEGVFWPFTWDTVRRAALRRDNWTCQICGIRPHVEHYQHGGEFVHSSTVPPGQSGGVSVYLEVDHVEGVISAPEREFDLENVRTLCRKCHGMHGDRPPTVKERSVALNTRLTAFAAPGGS